MVSSILERFKNIDIKGKESAIATLQKESTPNFDFYFLMVLSVLMATLGLIAGSEAVVIGSMLLAPILFPVVSLSFSVVVSNTEFIAKAVATLFRASVLSVVVSALATLIFAPQAELTTAILSRASPSLVYVGIAIVAGIAISYALPNPELSTTLPGIAVAVALLPPLAAVGIAIAHADWNVMAGALTLYIINVLGIFFAAMMMFALMDLQSVLKKEKNEQPEAKESESVEADSKA